MKHKIHLFSHLAYTKPKFEDFYLINAPKILQLSISLSVGVMVSLEMDVKTYIEKIDALEKTDHRQTIIQGTMGQTIIDNSFNSNPVSCISSLEVLDEIETEGKKYLITPGMVELGSEQFSYNYEFAHILKCLDLTD